MTDLLDFANQNVLVVGGSSGIGNGIAQAFRAHGGKVFVWGTRAAAADYAGVEGSDLEDLHYSQVDVADAAAIRDWKAPFDKLDVLVLSQGIVRYKRAEFQPEIFNEVMNVNLNSLMACAARFEAELAAARGRLIIVSSTAAYHATMGNPAYGASKTGAMGLTRVLGQAWGRRGIRVNGIAPGLVPTKLTYITTENPERAKASQERIPAGRFGTPQDMAGVALFLASPLSAYVVGQTIIVDGGLIL